MELKSKKIDTFILLFFFIGLFAYMPSARNSDKYIWIISFLLLIINSAIKFFRFNGGIKIYKCLIWYLIIIFYALISVFWSLDNSKLTEYIIFYFPIVIISVFCLKNYLNSESDIIKLSKIIVFAGTFAAIRYCFYTDWSFFLKYGYILRGSFGNKLDEVSNYNGYTLPLCVSCVFSAYLAIIRGERKYYLFLILLFSIVIIGGSRKNIIVIPIVILLFIFINRKNLLKKILAITIFIMAAFTFYYIISNFVAFSGIKQSIDGMLNGMFFERTDMVDDSTKMRSELFDSAIITWKNHPLMGVGWYNNYLYNDYQLYAHNSYAEILSCFGLLGFTLYYSYYIYLIYVIAKNKSNHLSSNTLCLGIIIMFLLLEFGTITLYSRELSIVLLLMGCIVEKNNTIAFDKYYSKELLLW